MKALRRMIFVFVASLVAAKLVDLFLSSDFGKRALRSAGHESLLTEKGTEAAKRYSKTATGLLVGTALALRSYGRDKNRRGSSTATTAENAAELVMAAGALAKIVSDFLHEEEEIRSSRGVA